MENQNKLIAGEGFIQYGSYSANNEYLDIEEKIMDLGICEELLNPNSNPTEQDKSHYAERKQNLLDGIEKDLSKNDIDLNWMGKFLDARNSYYTSERDKERAEGKEQVSPAIIGQLEATTLANEIVNELQNERTID